MARIQPTPGAEGADGAGTLPGGATGRRKAVRYAVPVVVAGVAASAIGIGSALASSGAPDLPKISAQDLIAKMAASDTQQMSGTVKISTDLGLPALPSGLSMGGDTKGKAKEGASPQAKLTELASGTHTLRVAADGPDRQRLSIVEQSAEYSVVRNGDQVWAYDSASNTAYHSKAQQEQHGKGSHGGMPGDVKDASPQEMAKKALAAADDTTAVTVDGTAKVAGRDAYQLLIKPKQSETTVDSIRIAVDAKNGVPLKFTLAPKGGGKAVVDASFTKVDFGKPAADTFSFTPPKGAKVTEAGKDAKGGGKEEKGGRLPEGMNGLDGLTGGAGHQGGSKVIGKGWASIAEFKGDKAAVPGKGKSQGADKNGDASKLLDSFGTKVTGDFGSGRVFSTRVVNALMTDDGRVYVGAVSKDALVKAANAAK
ncbi:outer membrane lipoprotein carrier protein LolA [Streptomyces sp. NPDC001404]|uniref:LolA family protein n=1 Tax=Streptomyces sp. NPDC001404 TaxID=3364571 RepID=UPI0036A548BA